MPSPGYMVRWTAVISWSDAERYTKAMQHPLRQRRTTFQVYRSDDQGRSWTQTGKGLSQSARVHSFLIADSVAYAGTDDGLFCSTDGGVTWSARVLPSMSRGPSVYPVQCLVSVGRRVYAGTENAGVFVTQNRGSTWRQVSKNLSAPNVRALSSLGGMVYAGTDSGGVFALREGKDTWLPLRQGLPERSQVFDLAIKGRALYAALYSKGLYRLDTANPQWERVEKVTPLRFVVRGNSLLAGHNPGGIYHSADQGATWGLARGLPPDAPIWVLGNAGKNVLAGTSPGTVFRSEDQGANWRPSAIGLPPGSAVVAIGAAPTYTLVAVLQDRR